MSLIFILVNIFANTRAILIALGFEKYLLAWVEQIVLCECFADAHNFLLSITKVGFGFQAMVDDCIVIVYSGC